MGPRRQDRLGAGRRLVCRGGAASLGPWRGTRPRAATGGRLRLRLGRPGGGAAIAHRRHRRAALLGPYAAASAADAGGAALAGLEPAGADLSLGLAAALAQ